MSNYRLAYTVPLAMLLLSAPAAAQTKFLSFPVKGFGPYDYRFITAVLDHDVDHDLSRKTLPFRKLSGNGPYGYSGAVLAFTGELFVADKSYPTANLACYPKPTNKQQRSIWSATLASAYTGTSGCGANVALNYDNHPGYDYKIGRGSKVYPASSGSIIFTKCILTFADSSSCESYGAIAVDHGNGFVTQYLHLSSLNYGKASKGLSQTIDTKYVLGDVSNTGVTAVHLHFEVLQRRSKIIDTKNYYARSNYMIVDPYGYNSTSPYSDKLQSKPGCLWASGCRY